MYCSVFPMLTPLMYSEILQKISLLNTTPKTSAIYFPKRKTKRKP